MKRGILTGDFHCGHAVGLTPPGWQWNERHPRYGKIGRYQREIWDWWKMRIGELPKLDFIAANGDLIDGSGYRSGGTEQITTDRDDQCDMAIEAMRVAARHGKPKIVMTYGTGYHTGDAEDFEKKIAASFNAKIGSHEWLQVEGVTFDLKHHIGSSSVPHGRYTAIAKDLLWSMLWSEMGRQPKSDVIVRSHVHYHRALYDGDHNKWAMTLPPMQGFATKYGSRRCSGTVSIGFVYVEVDGDEFTWRPILCEPKSLHAKATRV